MANDNKKLRVSLEEKLVEVGQEPDERDKRRRKRVELLAKILWQKSLDGDEQALRHLLSRLPVQTIIPHEPPRDPAPQADSFDSVISVLKPLVEAGIVPPNGSKCSSSAPRRILSSDKENDNYSSSQNQ